MVTPQIRIQYFHWETLQTNLRFLICTKDKLRATLKGGVKSLKKCLSIKMKAKRHFKNQKCKYEY